MHIPALRTLLAGGLTAFASALVTPLAAQAAPDDALASAAYGQAEVWWQRTPQDRSQPELVLQANHDATPRVLDVPPTGRGRHYTGLALGLDARGRLAVVMESRRGLVWTHVSGTPRLHRVPGTTRADSDPSLFRGRLAWIGLVDGMYSTVRLGSLTRADARTIWRATGSFVPWQVAIGARDAVALVTYREGAGNGAYQAHLLRPGSVAKPLIPTVALGDWHDGGIWIECVSTSGERVSITRSFDEAARTYVFALRTGRRIVRAATTSASTGTLRRPAGRLPIHHETRRVARLHEPSRSTARRQASIRPASRGRR